LITWLTRSFCYDQDSYNKLSGVSVPDLRVYLDAPLSFKKRLGVFKLGFPLIGAVKQIDPKPFRGVDPEMVKGRLGHCISVPFTLPEDTRPRKTYRIVIKTDNKWYNFFDIGTTVAVSPRFQVVLPTLEPDRLVPVKHFGMKELSTTEKFAHKCQDKADGACFWMRDRDVDGILSRAYAQCKRGVANACEFIRVKTKRD
jgi:hypothetical protein